MSKYRRVEQVACPPLQVPIEQELTIYESPAILPRVTEGPCVPPLSKRDYELCGG
jgi:hypothetical protein